MDFLPISLPFSILEKSIGRVWYLQRHSDDQVSYGFKIILVKKITYLPERYQKRNKIATLFLTYFHPYRKSVYICMWKNNNWKKENCYPFPLPYFNPYRKHLYVCMSEKVKKLWINYYHRSDIKMRIFLFLSASMASAVFSFLRNSINNNW
jgi:hypothetical protein